jgi:hypothetical protein
MKAMACIVGVVSLAAMAQQPEKQPELKAPPVVAPGATASAAPADAKVLIDGKSQDGWAKRDGTPAAWKLDEKAGTATVVPGAGDIVSKHTFGDAQIHVEFMTPVEQGDGQDRGNSGVYIHGHYEVQVLDSYHSETYPDGQCGAIYKQHVPLANACRPQGQWQTYDIVFLAPKFDASGKKTANATITVIHNGVLIQDHAEATSPTGSAIDQKETATGPLMLQEHGHPVAYRNVWVRGI